MCYFFHFSRYLLTRTSGGVNDNAAQSDINNTVNEFLTQMDGMNSSENIYVIGATNRKDILDDAVMRPKRLEIHLFLGLPDKKGRKDILEYFIGKNKNLFNINLDILSEEETQNLSGSDIKAVVQTAIREYIKKILIILIQMAHLKKELVLNLLVILI